MQSLSKSIRAILWTVTALFIAVIMMSALVQADDKDDKKKDEKKKTEQKKAPTPAQAKPHADAKPLSHPLPPASTKPSPATPQQAKPPAATQPGAPKPAATPQTPPTAQPGAPKPGVTTQTPPGKTQLGAPKPGAVTQVQPPPVSPSRPQKPFVAPPNTKVTKAPTGNVTYAHRDGRQWEVSSKGQVMHFSKPGVDARFHENGRVSRAQFARLDHSQMIVSNTIHGARRIEVVRPDHTHLVSFAPHYGYMERPISNRSGYISRTYVENGRSYAYVYRSSSYRDIVYYRYLPPVHYRPAFYTWAERPWRGPVRYDWGWRRDPWYAQYQGYFTPAPAYPTASLWLTDFLLASNLRLAYDSRPAAYAEPSAPAGTYAISPEVKLAIAEQVRRELAAERTAADQPAGLRLTGGGGQEVPPALDPNQRIFVVSMNLNAVTNGQECALTAGDIVLRTSENLVEGTKVPVTILNSKANDCAPNSSAALEVADLQEMHNNFRQQIGTGLSTLAANKGAGGLPKSPDAGPQQLDDGQTAVDPEVEAQLEKQQQEAAQTVAEFERAAAVGGQI